MREKFEAIRFATLAPFQSGMPNITVRQLGEQLDLPRDAYIVESSGYRTHQAVQRWIRDLHRGYTDYAAYLKIQLSIPNRIRLRLMKTNLDTGALAGMWTDFVNFPKRKETEIPFLMQHLKGKVFDACLGSGATTIGLKLSGIEDIISNDIDEDFIDVAKAEADKHRVSLDITNHDWRSLDKKYSDRFNTVLCLGNSITYLFKEDDQINTLRNFRNILRKGGKLIIDERNYAHHFLDGDYKFSGDILYCGKDEVSAHPVHISRSMVVMEYHEKHNPHGLHLVLYPFKEGELKGLIEKAGFSKITAFGDYKKEFKPEEPEFITYVCEK